MKLEVGDYLTWNPNPQNRAGGWKRRYPVNGVFMVTKIVEDEQGIGQIIRVRNVNGQRMRGPFWHGWFKKEAFLTAAAKAIKNGTQAPKT